MTIQIQDLLKENPLTIYSAQTTEIGRRHISNLEAKFNEIIKKNIGTKIASIKSLVLLKTKDSYILVDKKTNNLFYGLTYVKKDDGINITWMQNYSVIKKLTPLIFVNILKNDSKVKSIYSGDIHTPENKKLHKDLSRFKQLEVVIWDDRKKRETNENPYDGIHANNKLFKFMLEHNDIDNFNIGYLITPINEQELIESIEIICDLYYYDELNNKTL